MIHKFLNVIQDYTRFGIRLGFALAVLAIGLASTQTARANPSAAVNLSLVPTTIEIYSGSPQNVEIKAALPQPIKLLVKDQFGDPYFGAAVTLTPPAEGPSVNYEALNSNGNINRIQTRDTWSDGIASFYDYFANEEIGTYNIIAEVEGLPPVDIEISNVNNNKWYVSKLGIDTADCLTPASACATINHTLSKVTSTEGGKMFVATGKFMGGGYSVVRVEEQDVFISGGWNSDFTAQIGYSIIDGENSRRGIFVYGTNAHVTLSRLQVQNGYFAGAGGISAGGFTTIVDSIIQDNHSTDYGGGITTGGSGYAIIRNTLIINNSAEQGGGGIYAASNSVTVIQNSSVINNHSLNGGGIYGGYKMLWINNSTVSGNSAAENGGGIYAKVFANTYVNNVTISNNVANTGGGVWIEASFIVSNSILSGNSATNTSPDCYIKVYTAGPNTSKGYNIIGNSDGCSLVPGLGDQFNVDPKLHVLSGWMSIHTLQYDSPAIDAGNPAIPESADYTCEPYDQRGVSRPFDSYNDGSAYCDIGAFEAEYIDPPEADNIIVYSGSPQYVGLNDPLGEIFQAIVLDQYGIPFIGATVTFAAPTSSASGIFTDSGTNETTAITNAFGIVPAATFTANGIEGSYVVQATVSGVISPAEFQLSNVILTPTTIEVHSGSSQIGWTEQTFIIPLQALVRDQAGNPIQGVTVNFSAPPSGASGTFQDSGTIDSLAVTNAGGIATAAAFIANPTVGNYAVQASFEGLATHVEFDLSNQAYTPGVYFDLVLDENRGFIYASDMNNDEIHILSIDSLQPRGVIKVASSPKGLDISPDGNDLAVASAGIWDIYIIDLNTLNIKAKIGLSSLGDPVDLIYGRTGRLYASGQDEGYIIDTSTYTEVAQMNSVYGSEHLAISSDKNTLYDHGGNIIHAIDVTTDSVTYSDALLYVPAGSLHLNGDESKMFASWGIVGSINPMKPLGLLPITGDWGEYIVSKDWMIVSHDSQITAMDGSSDLYPQLFSYDLSGIAGPIIANLAETILYVSTSNGIEAITLPETAAPPPITLGAPVMYFDMLLDEDRGVLYGSDKDGGKIDVISISSLEVIASIDVGEKSLPMGIDMSPDGNKLAVALSNNYKIAILDLNTLTIDNFIFSEDHPYILRYGRAGRLYAIARPPSLVPEYKTRGGAFSYIYDPTTLTEVSKWVLSPILGRMVISADNNTLYVSSTHPLGPDQFYQVDISTDSPITIGVTAYAAATGGQIALNFDETKLFSSRSQVWSSDMSTLLGTFSAYGDEIEYISSADAFLVSNGSQISIFSGENYTLFAHLPLPSAAGVARADSTATKLYVSTEGQIIVLDLTKKILRIASGTPQISVINTAYSDVLTVKFADPLNRPFVGEVVTFTAPVSGASGTFSDTGTNTTTAIIDANGIATAAVFTANGNDGSYNVETSASGVADPVLFQLSNYIPVPTPAYYPITIYQFVAAGTTFDLLQQVTINDQFGYPIADLEVTLLAPESGPSVTFVDSGTNTTTALTNSAGYVDSPQLTANYEGGPLIVETLHDGQLFFQHLIYIILPDPPLNLATSQGDFPDRVDISWDPVPDADYYEIWQAPSVEGTKVLIASPTGTNFQDYSVAAGIPYHYWVRACISAVCGTFSASNVGYSTILAPVNLSASDGTYVDKVKLNWNQVEGVSFYKVYRHSADDSAAASPLDESVTSTSFDDTTASPGHTYFYWVKACNGYSCSVFSAVDSGYRSTEMFMDGFESGDFSAWDASKIGSRDLKVCRKAAINGSYGMCVKNLTNNSKFVTDNGLYETSYSAQFNLDPNGLKLQNKKAIRVFLAKMGTKSTHWVQFRKLDGAFQVRAMAKLDDGTKLKTNWYDISNAPHLIEVDWMASTGADDGYLKLYIDDVLKQELTGLDTDTLVVNQIRLGFTNSPKKFTVTGVFFIDDFRSSDGGYIGP